MLEIEVLARVVSTPQIYEIFGRRVAVERKALGFSQNELARRVGLSRASIANVEAGRQRVLLHQVLDFAHALGANSVGDFFAIDLRTSSRHGPTNQMRFNGSALTGEEAETLARLVESA